METIFISDGNVQLVLLPQNDLDSLLLNKLLGKDPIEVEVVRQPASVLGKSVKDAIIIKTKISQDASKAEEL